MADEHTRRYLFVAIERATRWVYVALKADKSARSATAFLKALQRACPIKITRLLTDNGNGAQHLASSIALPASASRKPTAWSNASLGRISDILKTHHFQSRLDLEPTLRRYVSLYNHHLPQPALNAKPPIHAMKQWHAQHPELFHRKPYNRPGLDS